MDTSASAILKLTAPLMFGTFVQSIVAFTDAAFVSKLGTIPFDAVGNAALIYLAIYMLSRGFGDGTQIRVAFLNGKKDNDALNICFRTAFSYQILQAFLLMLVLVFLVPEVTKSIVNNPLIHHEMAIYLENRSFGFILASLELVIVGFLVGIGKTRILLFSTVLLAIVNIFLDYFLIFGNAGFPKLGVQGAALASSIAEGISFLFLFCYLLFSKFGKKYSISFKPKISAIEIKALLKLSLPLMFQGFISISTWLIFFTFIEQMGELELEASQCIRHLYFLAFIPIFGFAMATKTYVSYFHGKEDYKNVKKIIKRLVIMSSIAIIIFFHGAIFYPEFLVSLVNNNPDINAMAAEILRLVSGSMLIFAISVIFYNAVAGLGKTNTSFLIEAITIGVYIIACIIIFKYLQWPVKWTWLVEYLYFCTSGIISIIYIINYLKSKNVA